MSGCASPRDGHEASPRRGWDVPADGYLRWVEIDHGALAHNVKALKRYIAPAQLWPVVKGRAYGHGAVEAARTFLQAGADGLAVSALAEAEELRAGGIAGKIFVMNPVVPWQAEAYVALGLTASVADWEGAEALSRAAAAAPGEPVPVHVKVDTGLGRFGLLPDEVVPFVRRLHELPGLRVEGIFTHLASADEEDKTFARVQLERFRRVLQALEACGLRPPLAHAANSPATLALPESHFDLVRNGLAVYGLYPSPSCRRAAEEAGVELRPALSLKARVVSVRRLAAGTPIGYGSTYRTPRETTIITLPIGYSDGVTRLLSNKLQVLVHGQRRPVVGRICMNHCMVDAGDLPVQRGDVVTLLGRDETGAAVPAEEWAAMLGTITYEVLCMVGTRNPRVHVYENQQAGAVSAR